MHIWVSCNIRLQLISLNQPGGLSLKKVDVFLWSVKGSKLLSFLKIFLLLSSRLLRYWCHSLSAMVSTSVSAAECETKRGKK